jgi:hypothetical protein
MAMMGGMMAAQPVMRGYTLYVLIPALVILAIVTLVSLGRYPALANRILVGIVAGVAGTVALDVVRLAGFAIHWMPANLPTMFGMLILGEQATRQQMELVGYVYHFLNGIGFALLYTLVLGRGRWEWGVVWGLIIWLLMMVTPPMLMMGVGPFGVNFGPGLAVATFFAHVAFGAVLGIVAQRWVRERGTVFAELSGQFGLAPQAH